MHQFHIPVLGLGFSIDTPLKVGRYGISSVVSVVDDELIERMRKHHCRQSQLPFEPIHKNAPDSRARRITAYLNLLKYLVDEQFDELRAQQFYADTDLDRYFNLLPDDSQLKQGYDLLREFPVNVPQRAIFEAILRGMMRPGAIDVNIMAKIDKMNFDAKGHYTGDANTDALAALRGFAESNLSSSVILSAGLNQRLYGYLESFEDFYPDENGVLKKKIILKVSDFRSAQVQAKLLAKKGLWVSEFRIESGLNCGGHAFATDGLLLGPILEEFKQKRDLLQAELFNLYQDALIAKNRLTNIILDQRISAQGGIGTAAEQQFLRSHYRLDATGWGSPFLLVPEATNVDDETLQRLTNATHDDFYVSNASPLGVLFNNFRNSTAEQQRLARIAADRPGSPCTKRLLVSNTEFTSAPLCTASRQYQALKIWQLKASDLPDDELQKQIEAVTEKLCLCEGLCASAYIKNDMLKARENKAVAICPGPNLVYFSKVYSLDEMVGHIYGKTDLLQGIERSHVFVNELKLYADYLKKLIGNLVTNAGDKQLKYIQKFKAQMLDGIGYYQRLFADVADAALAEIENLRKEIAGFETMQLGD
ncbi:hypothetical protein C8P68_103378 [Mucilaginibacter yixingensis]|uniref:Uncharacterized protein n=1 Tax=Mucilaginibacter yixingensis TaxID=1295612 RepID=A0A2T5JBH3_9SPHI|nr:hypothetical protein [Mucilaginibacter yixingensis]PTQ98217.1 hypothetical protein C8P68_103378 [Mucilaginibacter yixingensis]